MGEGPITGVRTLTIQWSKLMIRDNCMCPLFGSLTWVHLNSRSCGLSREKLSVLKLTFVIVHTVGAIAATMEGNIIPGGFPNVLTIPIPRPAYL